MLYGGLNPAYFFYILHGNGDVVLFVAGLGRDLRSRSPAAVCVFSPFTVWARSGCWRLLPSSSRVIEDGPLGWVHTVNRGLLMANPIHVWSLATDRGYDPRGGFIPGWVAQWNYFTWYFVVMAIIQASCGLLFLILAIAGLRPLRGSAWPEGNRKPGWFTRIRTRFHQFVESRAAARAGRGTSCWPVALFDRLAATTRCCGKSVSRAWAAGLDGSEAGPSPCFHGASVPILVTSRAGTR